MAYWFYIKDNQQVGPLSEQQILQAAESGDITHDTLMWTDQMEDWAPYSSVQDRIKSTPSDNDPQKVLCPYCHSSVTRDDLIQAGDAQICVMCKDQYVQMIKEGVDPNAPNRHYAGFWVRFCAMFLDGIILRLIQAPFELLVYFGALPDAFIAISAIISPILNIAIALTYYTLFIGNPKLQATPGKMAMKLKVIRSDGSTLSYGLAAGRYLAYIIDTLTLFIGYLMCVWDNEKRCLHDRICNTRVIRKP